MRIEMGGEALELDPSGVLAWPRLGLVAVADLHLEKGSAFARRGTLLPPYDTLATLVRLEAVLRRLRPQIVVSLGDGFHDACGPDHLSDELCQRLRRLTSACRWIWIRGNHDRSPPTGLGGIGLVELKEFLVLLKAQHVGKNAGRESFALGVKIAHYAVVKTARSLDFVLGVGQLAL